MYRTQILSALLLTGVVTAGCTMKRTVIVVDPDPDPGPSTAVTLGVPAGHLPPPGQCRVWVAGTPPGRQARARSCNGIASGAPAGSMILYRPGKDRRVVHVRYVDSRRAGVVVRVSVFEAQSGKYLRDERP